MMEAKIVSISIQIPFFAGKRFLCLSFLAVKELMSVRPSVRLSVTGQFEI